MIEATVITPTITPTIRPATAHVQPSVRPIQPSSSIPVRCERCFATLYAGESRHCSACSLRLVPVQPVRTVSLFWRATGALLAGSPLLAVVLKGEGMPFLAGFVALLCPVAILAVALAVRRAEGSSGQVAG